MQQKGVLIRSPQQSAVFPHYFTIILQLYTVSKHRPRPQFGQTPSILVHKVVV